MKKVLLTTVFVLVVLVVLVCISVVTFAATSQAAYAVTAPKIDGVIDDIWSSTPEQMVIGGGCEDGSEWNADGDYATGYSKILWDENYLYFLAVVTDFTPVSSDDLSCTNGINLWVSERNTKLDSFTENDGDYLYFCSSNGITRGDAAKSIGNDAIYYTGNKYVYDVALKAVSENKSGYIVEVMIPYLSKMTPVAGQLIGYTLSIDDEISGDGVRDATAITERDSENGGDKENFWSATAAISEIELLAKPESTVEITDTSDTTKTTDITPDVTNTTANPTTADVSAIFYALASLAAVSGLTISRKR